MGYYIVCHKMPHIFFTTIITFIFNATFMPQWSGICSAGWSFSHSVAPSVGQLKILPFGQNWVLVWFYGRAIGNNSLNVKTASWKTNCILAYIGFLFGQFVGRLIVNSIYKNTACSNTVIWPILGSFSIGLLVGGFVSSSIDNRVNLKTLG